MCEDRENEYVKRTTFFNTRIKTKIDAPRIRIQSITMEAQKKWWQRWKSIVQSNDQCCIWKSSRDLEKITDVPNLSNKSDYLKWIPQPSYMSHIIFDNDLGVIHKSKVTLSLN